MVLASNWGWDGQGDISQKIQTSSYKMDTFWVSNAQHVTVSKTNNTVFYTCC